MVDLATSVVISADLDIIEKMSAERSGDFTVFPFYLWTRSRRAGDLFEGSSKDRRAIGKSCHVVLTKVNAQILYSS